MNDKAFDIRKSSSPLKIALGDLRHNTAGRHSIIMPLGIGLIGSYARHKLGHDSVDMRLYDDPDAVLDDIDAWRPDVVGLANYCWNAEVAQLVFRYAKKTNPETVCVGGGPEFPSDPTEMETYLGARPWVDFFAPMEGERPFAALMEKIRAGVDLATLRREPQDGLVALHPESAALLAGPTQPRLLDLDEIPSPYAAGLMDQWFNGSFAPMIETARGCPYSCTFCVQGDASWSKIAVFSLERVKNDLTYMAERMKAFPGILLSVADANFGMYPRDEEVALHMRSLQDEYGWPNAFDVTTGKSHYERIVRVVETVRNKMFISGSVQSLHDNTLETIKRKNIPFDSYHELQRDLRDKGVMTTVETIIPLPKETKDSFFDGMRKLIGSGVSAPTVYTSMILKGTELASRQSRDIHGLETRYRILPRQFGEYRGEKCFEVEEVCVATNHMSFEEYLECRGFALVASAFSGVQYDVIHRHLQELGLDLFDYLYRLWELIKERDSDLKRVYEAYIGETREELFDTPEAIKECYSAEYNYRLLLSGEKADNLMRKYKTIIAASNSALSLDFAFSVLMDMVPANESAEAWGRALAAGRAWALATRDLKPMFEDGAYPRREDTLRLAFDVDRWYREGKKGGTLLDHETTVVYSISSNFSEIEAILDDHRSLYGDDTLFLASKLFVNWSPKALWRRCSYGGFTA